MPRQYRIISMNIRLQGHWKTVIPERSYMTRVFKKTIRKMVTAVHVFKKSFWLKMVVQVI